MKLTVEIDTAGLGVIDKTRLSSMLVEGWTYLATYSNGVFLDEMIDAKIVEIDL